MEGAREEVSLEYFRQLLTEGRPIFEQQPEVRKGEQISIEEQICMWEVMVKYVKKLKTGKTTGFRRVISKMLKKRTEKFERMFEVWLIKLFSIKPLNLNLFGTISKITSFIEIIKKNIKLGNFKS